MTETTTARERIGPVGCVKSKRRKRAAARDLYDSPLFSARRAWVEQTCDRWFVLSAERGHVEHRAMRRGSLCDEPRRAASLDRIGAGSLGAEVGRLTARDFELHSGEVNHGWKLNDRLVEAGAHPIEPMEGVKS